jgi:hypothetical protein
MQQLSPGKDESVFPKISSSVFICTDIDHVLRNLAVRHLIIAGCLTDQCVDSAVRDSRRCNFLCAPTNIPMCRSLGTQCDGLWRDARMPEAR